ncbi:uncharacterized protein LOC143368143 isoform X2 [Andrena cerasifolii]|uniref:uncharacterized protein LOC143368143 isoform X2 n=1 Tax=Andrena cerasifolii TaxID=2819439 RepID=UPI004037FBCD
MSRRCVCATSPVSEERFSEPRTQQTDTLERLDAAEKMLASRQSTPINPEETGNEPETKNPGTSRTEDGDMMEEYIWIGRTGRRNAMGYIWTRDAETRLLDLPDLIKGLSTVTVTDQPLIARQDPNAPGMSR